MVSIADPTTSRKQLPERLETTSGRDTTRMFDTAEKENLNGGF
jgi:hypothetical protein